MKGPFKKNCVETHSLNGTYCGRFSLTAFLILARLVSVSPVMYNGAVDLVHRLAVTFLKQDKIQTRLFGIQIDTHAHARAHRHALACAHSQMPEGFAGASSAALVPTPRTITVHRRQFL